jgi:predicted Rossmann-fold nucleotide-binding protein
MSDAFAVLPGGIGTVLEMTMVWQLLQVKHMENVPLLLVGSMWPDLVAWARKHMVSAPSPLASAEDMDIPRCFATAEEAIALLTEDYRRWEASR